MIVTSVLHPSSDCVSCSMIIYGIVVILYRFGGGPVCNHLFPCSQCQNELDVLRHRQQSELEEFIKVRTLSVSVTANISDCQYQ